VEGEKTKNLEFLNWVGEVFGNAVNELYDSIYVIHSLISYLMDDEDGQQQQRDWFHRVSESRYGPDVTAKRPLSNKMKGICQSLFFSLPTFSEILYCFFSKAFEDFNLQARQCFDRPTNSLDSSQLMSEGDDQDGMESEGEDGEFVNVTLSPDDALFYTKVSTHVFGLFFSELTFWLRCKDWGSSHLLKRSLQRFYSTE